MDELKVVIDISKHEWEYLNKLVKNGDQLGHYERLLVNGTPLPEGHGNVIDTKELPISSIDITDLPYGKGLAVVLLEDIENAPIIIEADKES